MTGCPLCGHDIRSSDDLILCVDTGTLIVAGDHYKLTPSETWVLELLKARYPKTVRTGEFMEYLYRPGSEPDKRIILVWMSRLRKYLDGTDWDIENSWAVGYRLVGPRDES